MMTLTTDKFLKEYRAYKCKWMKDVSACKAFHEYLYEKFRSKQRVEIKSTMRDVICKYWHEELHPPKNKDRESTGISAGSWNSWQIEKELNNEEPDINKIKKTLKEGIDINYRTDEGYSLSEHAGLKQHYHIVDLIYRSGYTHID